MSSHYIPIVVDSLGLARFDHVVSVDVSVDMSRVAGLRLLELADTTIIDDQVPFQIDRSGEHHRLTFVMRGVTSAYSTRSFRLMLDHEAIVVRYPAPLVTVSEVFHQSQPSYRIGTSSGEWIFHQQGAGFASLIDVDGNDWISFRPHGGSDGLYRGIPNIKNPQDYFHPGTPTGRSHVLSQGAVCCRIHAETLDGVCEAIYELYPTHLAIRLLKAPQPYWFLYEGTPAGKLDEQNGFIVRSDGTRTPAGESWDAVLDPGWLYFGSSEARQVLFFAQQTTEHSVSSYWPMEHNMTVFGFGRKELEDYLTLLPATYYVGLMPDAAFEEVSARIEALRQPIDVQVGALAVVS